MKRLRSLLPLGFALSLALASTPRAELFLELFDTLQHCDQALSTAFWDTLAGELKLHPYPLELIGGPDLPGELREFVLAGDLAYAIEDEGAFRVLDVSDPENIQDTGAGLSFDGASGLAVDGDHAYLSAGSGFAVVDISDPVHPWIAGSIPGLNEPQGIALAGGIAYLAAGNAGLLTIDISDSMEPTLLSTLDTPGFAFRIALHGDYAYVIDGYHGLAVVDIRSPQAPVLIHQVPAGQHMEQIRIAGQTAYVTDIGGGLCVFSLADPAAPQLIGEHPLFGHAQGIAVDGSHAYVTVADNDTTALVVFDIGDPAQPVVTQTRSLPGFPITLDLRGGYAFVNCYWADLQVLRAADPIAPSLVGALEAFNLVEDLVVDGALGFALGRVGIDSRFYTISLADPAAPTVLGSCPVETTYSGIEVAGRYAYVAAGQDGLAVVDLMDLTAPAVVAELDYGEGIWSGIVAGDYLFVGALIPWDYVLVVYDIADPLSPTVVAELILPRSARHMVRSGQYLIISQYEVGELPAWETTDLIVVDIGQPTAPFIAGEHRSPGIDYYESLAVDGNILYASFWTHISAPAGQGVQLFDISDPLDIQLLGRYEDAVNYGRIHLDGERAYLAASQMESFDVLDVSDPMAPQLLERVPTSFDHEFLVREGDFLYCAGPWGGLHALQVYDRRVDRARNAAQSTPLPNAGKPIAWAKLETEQEGDLIWEFSADAGAHWQTLTPGGAWAALAAPGSEPLWRAELLAPTPGFLPQVASLELEWRGDLTGIESVTTSLSLHQNLPNPFNPRTTIAFELPAPGRASIEIFDARGRRLRTLLDEARVAAGPHEQVWDGRDDSGQALPSGVYLYRLETGAGALSRRMVLLR